MNKPKYQQVFEQAELTVQIEVIKEQPFFSDLSVHKAPHGHGCDFKVLPRCRNALKSSVMGSFSSKTHRDVKRTADKAIISAIRVIAPPFLR